MKGLSGKRRAIRITEAVLKRTCPPLRTFALVARYGFAVRHSDYLLTQHIAQAFIARVKRRNGRVGKHIWAKAAA